MGINFVIDVLLRKLRGVQIPLFQLVLNDTRGELSAMADVDKWALSSCLMCHFGDFGDSNSPRSTTPTS